MPKRDSRTLEADFWGMARSFLHSYCPKVRGLSHKTVDAYRISLECLLGYLAEEMGLSGAGVGFDSLDRPCLRGWVEWMSQAKGVLAEDDRAQAHGPSLVFVVLRSGRRHPAGRLPDREGHQGARALEEADRVPGRRRALVGAGG